MCKIYYHGEGCISKYEVSSKSGKVEAKICVQLDNTYECEDKKKVNVWVDEENKNAVLIDVNHEFTVEENLLPYINICLDKKHVFMIENNTDYKLISIAYTKE